LNRHHFLTIAPLITWALAVARPDRAAIVAVIAIVAVALPEQYLNPLRYLPTLAVVGLVLLTPPTAYPEELEAHMNAGDRRGSSGRILESEDNHEGGA
jgi:hypothetical protein